VIFCDLMMPRLTGQAFWLQLHQSAPELVQRVVFMTGGAPGSPTHRFLESIPNYRIEKPFSSRTLEQAIEHVASVIARS
jgi:CheY-like chemotaxis protein